MNKFLIFLKGILMGVCDLIPGISGGTVAFITGIYIKLINSVKGISPKLFKDFFNYLIKRDKKSKKIFDKSLREVNLGFLLILFLGIISAILIGSRIIKYFLEIHPAYIFAFFIGLILSSVKIIFCHIKNHELKNILFGFIGLIIGIVISLFSPLNIESPNLVYVFLGGFFAISAMFLPGISGAFILLIMGLYEFMINVLHNILENFLVLIVFIFGMLLGIFFISRLISFLFEKDKCKTLYFLLGLVIGALSIPFRKVLEVGLGVEGWFIVVFWFLLGVFLVVLVDGFGRE